MRSITTVLENLSLNQAEITVYLLLLQGLGLSIAELCERTPFHRPRVMQILSMLEARGLVVTRMSGRRIKYQAASPYVLVEQAKNALSDVKHALPELIELQNKHQQNEQIRVVHGEQGLAACFLDVVVSLGKEGTFYQISSAKDQQFVDSLVPAEYRPIRDAKGLERRAITTRYVGSHKQPRLERSMRFIEESDEVFEHNVIQFIYGDKVALLDFNTLTGTIIQNKAIADFQRSVFLTLYKRLKE